MSWHTPSAPGELGAVLRGHRMTAGLTQAEVARRSGVSLRTLRDLEQGRVRSPRARSLQRLAEALALTAADRELLAASIQAHRTGAHQPAGVQALGLRVDVLGPLSVRLDGEPVEIRAPLQRTLLGLLALQPEQVVSETEMIEVLWGDQPPPTHPAPLHSNVARLRGLLEPGRPPHTPARTLVRAGGGYRMNLTGHHLDLARFGELATEAERTQLAGGPEPACDLFTQALACWRGPLLADVRDHLRAHPAAVAARRHRARAALAFADCAAELGRHEQAAALLWPVVYDEWLHEPLHARLMLALAACGQQAEALRLFSEVRTRLADELGVDPGAELQAAHVQVLRGAPSVAAPAIPGASSPASAAAPRWPSPAELPATIASFAGRTHQLAQLAALTAGDSTAPVTVIAGTAGVGKTALAVHFAHQVRDHYPDGQLFINLRGYAPTPPLQPLQALARFLGALGIEPDRIPANPDQAAGLYRSLLAGRRMLILLDNAAHPDQVRPLLPGTVDCLVLVTSRGRLSGLVAHDDARQLALDVLAPDEAVELLGSVLGRERVAAEPAAAATLARVCAHLPLALRVAAANLADQPQRPIAAYVTELDTGEQLDQLTVDGDQHGTVRTAFGLSYQRLPADARRLFRRLGLGPGLDFTAEAAAALAGMTLQRTARLLELLTRVGLLDGDGGGRFGFHDLLRRYALDRAEHDDNHRQRQMALRRLLGWYLRTVDIAAKLLYPGTPRLPMPASDVGFAVPDAGFDDPAGALAWLSAEQANLVAAVRHAAQHGPRQAAWLLADTLRNYFWLCRHMIDWLAVARAGLAAATEEADLHGQAAAQLSLGYAALGAGRYEAAIGHYTAAAELARRAGWVGGHAAILVGLGTAYSDTGRVAQAIEHQTAALALHRQAQHPIGAAHALGNLGNLHEELGALDTAAGFQTEALELYRELGSRLGEANSLAGLGGISSAMGCLDQAAEQLTHSLTLQREIGDRCGEAYSLGVLAAVHSETGRHAHALELASAALALAEEISDRRTEAETHNILGLIHLRQDHQQSAADQCREALAIARQAGLGYVEIGALLGLAAAERHAGRHELAVGHTGHALDLATRARYRLLEGQAQSGLAEIALARGRHDQAVEHARRALDIHDGTGQRLWRARTLVVLGHAVSHTGEPEAAEAHWREALDLFSAAGSAEAGMIAHHLSERGVHERVGLH